MRKPLTIRRLMLWVALSALGCALILQLPNLLSLLSSIIAYPRINDRRIACLNNLKNVAFALRAYHDDYGCFPPAYVADASGKPMHSWRVLILPYIDEQALYNDYDFSEPWDGPHNRTLAGRMPSILACPGDPGRASNLTSYLAITGPGTAFPGAGTTSLANFLDGPDRTILVAESTDAVIPWMEPRDLDATILRFASSGARPPNLSCPHDRGPAVAFADASVAAFNPTLRPANLRALATINGGEAVDWP